MTDETPVTRTERLLALLVLQNMAEAPQTDKSLTLSQAGFTNPQIADLLGTSTQTVSQNLYSVRKATARKGRAKATKAVTKKQAVSKKKQALSKRGQRRRGCPRDRVRRGIGAAPPHRHEARRADSAGAGRLREDAWHCWRARALNRENPRRWRPLYCRHGSPPRQDAASSPEAGRRKSGGSEERGRDKARREDDVKGDPCLSPREPRSTIGDRERPRVSGG